MRSQQWAFGNTAGLLPHRLALHLGEAAAVDQGAHAFGVRDARNGISTLVCLEEEMEIVPALNRGWKKG